MDKMHYFVKTIKIMAIKTSREPEKSVFQDLLRSIRQDLFHPFPVVNLTKHI